MRSEAQADRSERSPFDESLRPDELPGKAGFLGLMRWISARHPELPPVGRSRRPRQESFRLGQKPSLAFAPREIAQIERKEALWHIKLFGLGLLGPNGPMPLQFTDFVRERAESRQDGTIVDFLDLFHHRYLSLLYHAWAAGQATAGLDRIEDERFSRYVTALSGAPAAADSALPSHARLAAAAHLVREARNPDGLASTLARFFAAPVRIVEFSPLWIDIHPSDQSRLGAPGQSSTLGEGAFAGEKILDRQHSFRVVIGPLPLVEYLSFTPTGRNLPRLVEWVRAFVGFEFAWEIEIIVAPAAAPPARLGANERLGWSTWLGESKPDVAVSGLVFEPELSVEWRTGSTPLRPAPD